MVEAPLFSLMALSFPFNSSFLSKWDKVFVAIISMGTRGLPYLRPFYGINFWEGIPF